MIFMKQRTLQTTDKWRLLWWRKLPQRQFIPHLRSVRTALSNMLATRGSRSSPAGGRGRHKQMNYEVLILSIIFYSWAHLVDLANEQKNFFSFCKKKSTLLGGKAKCNLAHWPVEGDRTLEWCLHGLVVAFFCKHNLLN